MIKMKEPLAAAGLALLLLTGCSTGAVEQATEPPAATHTMPDGTTMQGSHHPKSDDHHGSSDEAGHKGGHKGGHETGHEGGGHETGHEAGHETGHEGGHETGHEAGHAGHEGGHDMHGSDPVGPSAAARMVCTGQVVADVTRITGQQEHSDPSSSWEAPMFTCTFELDQGPLVLTVHDAPNARTGRDYFEDLRADLDDTEPLKGVYALGLPAYETTDGTVVFIKDGKTLRVDATALPAKIGPDHSLSRTEAAYAVATSVLTCWTEHT